MLKLNYWHVSVMMYRDVHVREPLRSHRGRDVGDTRHLPGAGGQHHPHSMGMKGAGYVICQIYAGWNCDIGLSKSLPSSFLHRPLLTRFPAIHSEVGAVMGFALVWGGTDAIDWDDRTPDFPYRSGGWGEGGAPSTERVPPEP